MVISSATIITTDQCSKRFLTPSQHMVSGSTHQRELANTAGSTLAPASPVPVDPRLHRQAHDTMTMLSTDGHGAVERLRSSISPDHPDHSPHAQNSNTYPTGTTPGLTNIAPQSIGHTPTRQIRSTPATDAVSNAQLLALGPPYVPSYNLITTEGKTGLNSWKTLRFNISKVMRPWCSWTGNGRRSVAAFVARMHCGSLES